MWISAGYFSVDSRDSAVLERLEMATLIQGSGYSPSSWRGHGDCMHSAGRKYRFEPNVEFPCLHARTR